MRSRIQSAMEYLMTYGWAILVIAVVLGVLYSLGIFSPSNFAPKAQPGSCQVFRPNGPGTSYDANLEGTCSGELPQYVAQFDGASSYIYSSTSNSIPMSITAWFELYDLPTGNTSYGIISSHQGEAFPTMKVSLIAGVPGLSICGTNIGSTASPIALTTGKWYFGTLIVNSSGQFVYLNGGNVGSVYATPSISTNLVNIGYQPGTCGEVGYFSGALSNIQIYNTSLSLNDIQSIYAAGIGGVPIDAKHIISWWPLNGNPQDYSGNNAAVISYNVIYSGSWAGSYSPP